MIDELNRLVALASIPCAGIALYTGNMWWLAPIIYAALLAGRQWLLTRRRTPSSAPMKDADHDKKPE